MQESGLGSLKVTSKRAENTPNPTKYLSIFNSSCYVLLLTV